MVNKSSTQFLQGVSLALSGLTLLLFLYPGAGAFFQFDRTLLISQPWRWLTGHFTHWNGDHLIWDLVIFAGVGWFCEKRNQTTFLICLLMSTTLISMAVWLAEPHMVFYRGLSGVDSALYTLLAFDLIRNGSQKFRIHGYLALAGFFAKLFYEWATGSTFFVQPGSAFVPVPLAHLSGAICGIVSGLIGTGLSRRKPIHTPRSQNNAHPDQTMRDASLSYSPD